MINNFKNYSINKKLRLAFSVTALFFMFFSLLVSTTTDVKLKLESADSELNTLADKVALNVATAIVMNDSDLANNILDALKAENIVMQAKILNADGMNVASYFNLNHPDAFWHKLFPFSYPLAVVRPITSNGKRVGTIHLFADRGELIAGVVLRLTIDLLGFIAAYMIGYFFLRRMVKQILQPMGS